MSDKKTGNFLPSATTDLAVPPTPEERKIKKDLKGKFIKGTAPGPGNPYLRQQKTFKHLLFACTTKREIRKIVRIVVDKALNGDRWAIEQILDRYFGKATQVIDAAIDTSSMDEGQKLTQINLLLGGSASPDDAGETELEVFPIAPAPVTDEPGK